MFNRLLLLLIIAMAALTVQGQGTSAKPATDSVDALGRLILDKNPSFPGGEAEMIRFIRENLEYPKLAIASEIEGTVHVQFIVSDDGTISEIKVKESMHEMLNPAALAIIMKMPKWIPGYYKNRPVKVMVVVPIKFKLTDPVTPTKTK